MRYKIELTAAQQVDYTKEKVPIENFIILSQLALMNT